MEKLRRPLYLIKIFRNIRSSAYLLIAHLLCHVVTLQLRIQGRGKKRSRKEDRKGQATLLNLRNLQKVREKTGGSTSGTIKERRTLLYFARVRLCACTYVCLRRTCQHMYCILYIIDKVSETLISDLLILRISMKRDSIENFSSVTIETLPWTFRQHEQFRKRYSYFWQIR